MRHPYVVFNERTQERLIFYNDETDKNTDGSPSGKGRLQVDIYDAEGVFIGTFPADGYGIGAQLMDDSEVGADYSCDPVGMIAVYFYANAAPTYYKSFDDGRTWILSGADMPTAAMSEERVAQILSALPEGMKVFR